ncbi:phosphoglucosamine mutase [Falsigemmobacter faecalis]|uniref:Phosphoglucosamine mutase n=1 Tax=Falsigemmobacter faecalis TaxID=2488730 RepID=A0A3P3DF75_9RHOB|nr:phosphoglucosamine mutase [Falsigemmobacter faecalis]RRH71178.1 phosphoglucosamine mutase [Falsigemmobacter faecalis]
MAVKLFGTDGVRGTANQFPITAEAALKLGIAAGSFFRRDGRNGHRVVLGKDTRRSCYMLENALAAGLSSAGMNVILLGPVPTPAVGFLTRSMRADLGVMISASHNPARDNGIKFFGPDGFKLPDEDEATIEDLFENQPEAVEPDQIGRLRRLEDGRGRYVEFAKTTINGARFDGLKVVVDCAHGAAYRTAPEALWELGADVVPMGVAPDGFNINLDCGSTHPEAAAAMVRATGADLGICLDGDADRIILIDETGAVADGDQIMALFAEHWGAEGKLKNGTLVATVMSNLGLERFLEGKGLTLERTKVGDRHVVARMREGGFNLGGEQSGHIVMSDYATTGDGLMAGLQFMALMKQTGLRASELVRRFTPVPQVLRNLRLDTALLQRPEIGALIKAQEVRLGKTGRILVRPSGTEPLIRVMVEAEDSGLLEDVLDTVEAGLRPSS